MNIIQKNGLSQVHGEYIKKSFRNVKNSRKKVAIILYILYNYAQGFKVLGTRKGGILQVIKQHMFRRSVEMSYRQIQLVQIIQ